MMTQLSEINRKMDDLKKSKPYRHEDSKPETKQKNETQGEQIKNHDTKQI